MDIMQHNLARRCGEKEHRDRWYKDDESTTPPQSGQYYHHKAERVWTSYRTSTRTLVDRRLSQYFHAVKREVGNIAVPRSGTVEYRFHQLVCRWRAETKTYSSTTDKVLHSAYQDIMGMGPAALPLILREMEEHGGHWFWALRHISQDNPVPPEDAGKIPKMTEAWLRWGREHRYL